jgi:hypothetical protein
MEMRVELGTLVLLARLFVVIYCPLLTMHHGTPARCKITIPKDCGFWKYRCPAGGLVTWVLAMPDQYIRDRAR